MALHDRETIRDQFEDCVFTDRDLTRPVAKYRFPPEGTLSVHGRPARRSVKLLRWSRCRCA